METSLLTQPSSRRTPVRVSRVQRLSAFQQVVYSGCWEDTETELAALDLRQGARVLSITASGSRSLGLLEANPRGAARSGSVLGTRLDEWQSECHISTMSVAIDAAGRLVIPKAVREAAGIEPGTPLAIRFRDGRIEIEPTPLQVSVRNVGGVAVATPVGKVPKLGAEQVARVRDGLRDERG